MKPPSQDGEKIVFEIGLGIKTIAATNNEMKIPVNMFFCFHINTKL